MKFQLPFETYELKDTFLDKLHRLQMVPVFYRYQILNNKNRNLKNVNFSAIIRGCKPWNCLEIDRVANAMVRTFILKCFKNLPITTNRIL